MHQFDHQQLELFLKNNYRRNFQIRPPCFNFEAQFLMIFGSTFVFLKAKKCSFESFLSISKGQVCKIMTATCFKTSLFWGTSRMPFMDEKTLDSPPQGYQHCQSCHAGHSGVPQTKKKFKIRLQNCSKSHINVPQQTKLKVAGYEVVLFLRLDASFARYGFVDF